MYHRHQGQYPELLSPSEEAQGETWKYPSYPLPPTSSTAYIFWTTHCIRTQFISFSFFLTHLLVSWGVQYFCSSSFPLSSMWRHPNLLHDFLPSKQSLLLNTHFLLVVVLRGERLGSHLLLPPSCLFPLPDSLYVQTLLLATEALNIP